jgi:hypothetical protein
MTSRTQSEGTTMADLAEHAEVFGGSHDEVVLAETDEQVQTLAERLSQVPFEAREHREQVGAAMLGALRGGRGAAEPFGLTTVAVDTCRSLPSPTFSMGSSPSDTDTSYSLADHQAGTLRVRARTGVWGGVPYPGEEGSFLMPFNTANAWIGAAIPIPPHGSPTHVTRTLLDVSVELFIEQIWANVQEPVPGTGGDLVLVTPGDGDQLPLRGNAVAWLRAGLTLYTEGGARSRRSAEIVSAWVNRDGSDKDDHSSAGTLNLRHAVIISPALEVAGVFVDLTCFAAAEIAGDPQVLSAYADLKCRSGDGYPVPSQVRVEQEQVQIRMCELPDLADVGVAAASHGA